MNHTLPQVNTGLEAENEVRNFSKGYIKEIFQIKRWLVAGTLKYSTIPQQEKMVAGRWEFEGVIV